MAGSMGSVSIDPLTSEFDADVIRPEHLHAIWILPKNDAGFRCAEIWLRVVTMSKNKKPLSSKKQETSLARSSAAAVIRNFRITAVDGKSYNTKHYHLAAIIAVGYKVNSERAVQFRKWATGIIEEYTIKAYVMDDERIKSGGSILTDQYFEEQLQRIREIRLSERKFYQKITDIYATAVDYDVTAQATQRFFATVQNKLHWAIHGQTAAEVIYSRQSEDTHDPSEG